MTLIESNLNWNRIFVLMNYGEIARTIGWILQWPEVTPYEIPVKRKTRATERRELDGVHYRSSVHPQEAVYSLACHFVPEGKEIEVIVIAHNKCYRNRSG